MAIISMRSLRQRMGYFLKRTTKMPLHFTQDIKISSKNMPAQISAKRH